MARKKKNSVPDLTQEFRANSGNNPYNPYQQPQSFYEQPGQYPQPGYNPYPQYQQQPPVEMKVASEETPSKKKRKDRSNKPSKSRLEQHEQVTENKPPQEPQDDEEIRFKKRSRNKKIIRGTLVVINFALLAYLVFSVASLIKGVVDKKTGDAESFINLCGMNKKESEEIYDYYLKKDTSADSKVEATKINDYAIYGDNLYVSGLAISNTNTTSFQNLFYVNVCAKEQALVPSVSDYLDLGRLAEGDYLIVPNKEGKGPIAGKYTGTRALNETFYLRSPESDYKEITLKNNSASPALVISVRDITTPATDHVDVVFYAETRNQVPDLGENIKTKVCLKEDGLECVYLASATYAIDLTGTENLTSSFDRELNGFKKTGLTKEGVYSGFEESVFIRELGGYITKSGSCLDDESCLVKPYLSDFNRGSKSYTINKSLDNSTIKDLVNRILLA